MAETSSSGKEAEKTPKVSEHRGKAYGEYKAEYDRRFRDMGGWTRTGITVRRMFCPILGDHWTLPSGLYMNTPYTKWGPTWYTQSRGYCKATEMEMYRCLSRTGMQRGKTACYEILEDFRECKCHHKSRQRWIIMAEERRKQKRPTKTIEPDVVEWYSN